MSRKAVCEYLNTQGLTLPAEEVEMAVLAAQTVLHMAQAEIDHSVLFHQDDQTNLTQKLGINEQPSAVRDKVDCLTATDDSLSMMRQLFLAIDSWYSRHRNLSVGLYLMEKHETDHYLLRLVNRGEILPTYIHCDEQQMQLNLFVRTAFTGWLYLIEDINEWLQDGSLTGTQTGLSQLSLPVNDDEGRVIGVIFVSHETIEAFNTTQLIDWIGMAIAIEPLMVNLHAVVNAAATRGINDDSYRIQ